jgi:hypothetical protein
MEKINKTLIKILVPIVSFFCLNACTMERIPLTESQQKNIHHSQEQLYSPQKKLQVTESPNNGYVPPNSGIAGAVIMSIAANAENARRNTLITPLQKDFINGHYNNFMNENLSQELKSVKWLHLNESKVTTPLRNSEKTTIANQLAQTGDAVIYVDMTYTIAGLSLDALNVSANVSVYKKEIPKALLIYQNTFDYYDVLKSPNPNPIDTWAKNNSSKLDRSMRQAIQMLSSSIAKDIQTPQIMPEKNHPSNIWYSTPQSGTQTGYFEGTIKNKSVIRRSSGQIAIVNSSSVTQKHNWRE